MASLGVKHEVNKSQIKCKHELKDDLFHVSEYYLTLLSLVNICYIWIPLTESTYNPTLSPYIATLSY